MLLLIVLQCKVIAQSKSVFLGSLKEDTLKVKQIWQTLFEKGYPRAVEDSLIFSSLNLSQAANQYAWSVRILNFWSQQKIIINDFQAADSLIDHALRDYHKHADEILAVDYRDALFQKAITKYYQLEWDSCVYFAQKVQQLAKHAGDDFNHSIAISLEAAVYPFTRSKSADEIEELFLRAIALAKKTTTRHDDAMALHNYASWLRGAPLFDLERSMEALLDMQDFAQQPELATYTIFPYKRAPFFYRGTYRMMLVEMSFLYLYLGNYQESIKYIDEVLVLDEFTRNERYRSYVLVLKAYVETFRGETQVVKDLIDQGVQSYQQFISPGKYPNSRFYYYCLGWLAEQRGDYTLAITRYQKALDRSVFQNIGNDSWDLINENHAGLLRAYLKAGKITSADSLFSYVSIYMDQNSVPFLKLYFLKELPFYYKSKNMETEALQASLEYYMLKDSLVGISTQTIANAYEKKFQLREKERLLELSKVEKERDQAELLLRNRQLYLSVIGLIAISLCFLGVLVGFNFKRNQTKRLAEKNEKIETLIRELHHRVKNNLQVVAGLLYLQRNKVSDDEVKNVISEAIGRVDAMAMIHRKLYTGEELSQVDMEAYCMELLKYLSESFGWRPNQIKIHFLVKNASMDIDYAVPLGLIINELMTNSFKHARGEGIPQEIDFHFKEIDGSYEVIISDNGRGRSAEASDTYSFGTKLISLLAKQIDAKIDYLSNDTNMIGLSVRIRIAKKMLKKQG